MNNLNLANDLGDNNVLPIALFNTDLMKVLQKLVFLILLLYSNTIIAQKYEFWGTTSGGQNSNGTIFKTDSLGNNIELVYRFENNGEKPINKQLTKGPNGNLYIANSGGNYLGGVIAHFNPNTNVYTPLYHIDSKNQGVYPVGRLLLASNNKFYGMCKYGGIHNTGIIYEYDPTTNVFLVLFNFDTISTGCFPEAGLMQASNGKLYGLTNSGGNQSGATYYSPGGTLFEFDLSTNVFTKKFTFWDGIQSGLNSGSKPVGELIQATNGKLYGVTNQGGNPISNGGVLFEFDILLDTLIIKHRLTNSYPYNQPVYSLHEVDSGILLGNTLNSIFKYNTSTNTFQNINTSIQPNGQLTYVPNGKLYGYSNHNTLFEYNIQTNTVLTLTSFQGATGYYPSGGLYYDTSGSLYGLTLGGGIYNSGVIFKYIINSNTCQKAYEFTPCFYGRSPKGSLLFASDSCFYGMTNQGGLFDKGVIFRYNPRTDSITKLIDFNDTTGFNPYGSLIETTNGNLFGMTHQGGMAGSNGTFFNFNYRTGTFAVLVQLVTSLNFDMGGAPFGDLITEDSNIFYGLTNTYCGTKGGILKYNLSTNSLSGCQCLNYLSNGIHPEGSFLIYNPGHFVATTKNSGENGFGTIFSYFTQSSSSIRNFSFNGLNGKYPTGNLIKANGNKLYGLTSFGGSNDDGVLFEYNLQTGLYTKKLDFLSNNIGAHPRGSLVEGKPNLLYGMTSQGGLFNKGVLFEYNLNSNLISIKHHFDGSIGENPLYSNLIKVDVCAASPINYQSVNSCNSYLSPSGKIYTTSGTFSDTIVSSYGCDSIISTNLTIHSSTLQSQTVNLCAGSSFNWNGQNLMTSGVYQQYYTSAQGCDSIERLVLHIHPDITNVRTTDLCLGDSVALGNIWLSAAGVYIDTLQTTFGCDSLVKLTISVSPDDSTVVQSGDSLIAQSSSAQIVWWDCQKQQLVYGVGGQVFVPNYNGHFAARLTQNGCTYLTRCFEVTGVGIDQNAPPKGSPIIDIWPNPAKDKIFIKSSENISNVSLIDSYGKTVLELTDLKSKDFEMDISTLANGIYLMKMEWENGVEMRKMVKE